MNRKNISAEILVKPFLRIESSYKNSTVYKLFIHYIRTLHHNYDSSTTKNKRKKSMFSLLSLTVYFKFILKSNLRITHVAPWTVKSALEVPKLYSTSGVLRGGGLRGRAHWKTEGTGPPLEHIRGRPPTLKNWGESPPPPGKNVPPL